MYATLHLLALVLAPPEAPLPELHVEAVPAGSILRVRNIHSEPLAACFVRMVDYPGGRFEFLHDSLELEAIPAGGERRFEVTSMLAGVAADYLRVVAAVYLDGTVTGGAPEIARILAARRERLKSFREALQCIETGKRKGASEQEVRSNLARVAEASTARDLSILLNRLKEESLDRVAAHVSAAEQALASSKPPLAN